MKNSEKTLELNVGAEILQWIRRQPGMSKAILRGLTQTQEKAEGVDFYAQLDPRTCLYAFQFKAPRVGRGQEEPPYKFTFRRTQHELLYQLGQHEPRSVLYTLPFLLFAGKLCDCAPYLLAHTWFLRAADVKPADFKGQSTITVTCKAGEASINPDYPLFKAGGHREHLLGEGISVSAFRDWCRLLPEYWERPQLHGDPWLFRGTVLAVVPPEGA